MTQPTSAPPPATPETPETVSLSGASSPDEQTKTSLLDRLHALLRRSTWSLHYLPVIDGMRFIAIMSVLLHHMMVKLPKTPADNALMRAFLGYGNLGVQLFFAISGFVLAIPFLRQHVANQRPVSLRDYYLRRLVRLEPPYLINLGLFFLLGFYPSCIDGDDIVHLAWSAVYMHNSMYNMSSNINFVAWSLEVEVQFYLLMPLFAWLFFRLRHRWWRRASMLLACVPFMLWQHLRHGANFPHGLSLPMQLQFFVAGIILADIFVHDWDAQLAPRTEGRWRFDALALLSFAAVIGAMALWRVGVRFVLPLLLLTFGIGVLRSVAWRRILENRWIAATGGMCYTIYLYHWFLIYLLLSYFGGFPFKHFWANVLIAIPLFCFVLVEMAAIPFLLFEKPFMRWRPFLKKNPQENRR